MTQQEFNQMLAVAIAGGLGGGTYISRWDGEQIDDILTKALRQPGRNLLINAYFVGGGSQQGGGQFPINQRGVTGTISTPGYFIDRWKLVSGSVTITAAGLVLNGTMVQILEQGLTSPFTASVLRSDGLFPAQYDNATKTFTITATGQTIIAAKLEAGPNQTVAHQDADGNWVLNDPPDFGLELAKCQRYQLFGPLSSIHMSKATNNTARVFVPAPVTLRGNPAIVGTIGSNIRAYSVATNSELGGFTLGLNEVSKNGIFLNVKGLSEPAYIWFYSGAGFDCNL